jgi:hypothetical protein
MAYMTVDIEMLKEENTAFYERWESSLRDLFDKAREAHELWFAFSLNPEFRGCQDPGWSTADDAMAAFDEYLQFINEGPITSLKARVALGFYSHLSEASGFYEIPKNMLRVAEGKPYVLWPFKDLVEKHRVTGNVIAPNANKVLKDLAGHAESLGFHPLAMCFRDAFDPDLRNGYAHADYVIWSDGIRLRKRNGGYPRKVSWEEFNYRFERGINFFHLLREIVSEYVASYREPKTIKASLDGGPEMCWTIHADPDKHSFSISGGLG